MLGLTALFALGAALAGSGNASPLVERAKSAGCGTSHTSGYNTNGGSGFALGNRTYTILVPPKYSASRAYPLIVDFHGRDSSSDHQHDNSQYDVYDTSGDFLVVYPQGIKSPNKDGDLEASWEGASYADPNVNDRTFTTSLVQHIQDNYCIDSNRIYASGKSNGGGFVGTLACSAEGSIFAAFALNSPALYTDNLKSSGWTCKPSRSQIPIIEVHGSTDTTVSYNGDSGAGGTTPPISKWLDTWATRNGAVDKQVHFPSPAYGSRVNITTWHASGTSNILVQGIWIKDVGHCWAASASNYDWTVHSKATCEAPLNASTIFLNFFNTWSLSGFTG